MVRLFVILFILFACSSANAQDANSQQKNLYTGEYATCTDGLRSCDSLRNDPEEYWTCMQKTCGTTKDKRECDSGKNKCAWITKAYNKCLSRFCPVGKNKIAVKCSKAEYSCRGGPRQYWECIDFTCRPPYDLNDPEVSTKYYIYRNSSKTKYKDLFEQRREYYHLDKDGMAYHEHMH